MVLSDAFAAVQGRFLATQDETQAVKGSADAAGVG
jgi:hypothetical protein